MSAPKPAVFVTRQLPGDALSRLESHASVDVWAEEMPPPYDELVRRTAPVHGLICLLTDRIDTALIAAAPALKVISTMAVGYDNIDTKAAAARGIAVGHTPGVLTEATADLAFALLLAAARRIVEAESYLRAGRWRTWDPNLLLGRSVHGQTIGVVGYGQIGRAVARRARGFGMHVLCVSRTHTLDHEGLAEMVDLATLLRRSDYVSLHVPLTPETYHMIGREQLAEMKPTSILVNTSRGAVIDQRALVQALNEGWIGGAALDVMEEEPLPPDDPLLCAPNTVLVPHIGSATHATRRRMAEIAVDNCIAGLRGKKLPFPVPQA
jgi:glyoxylate reductase